MSTELAEITAEALGLPEHEQLQLERIILDRVEAVGEVEVDAAWEEGIESRIRLGQPMNPLFAGRDRTNRDVESP